jgi:putative ABC transport system permease protein
METLWQDLRYGFRMLARNPGFTTVAVLTLALGIGANASIFSVVNGILLGPLPYPEADRLVQLYAAKPSKGWDDFAVSHPDFLDWSEQNESFEGMAIYRGRSLSLTGEGEPERLRGLAASAKLFSVLGRSPAQGRAFRVEEDRPGADRVAVLSHGLWERRFGSDPDLLGRTLILDGVAHTVVGIMPADFFFPSPRTELWVPLALDPAKQNRGSHSYEAIGRLKPGVTLPAGRAELNTIAQRLEQEYPDSNAGWRVSVISLYDELFDDDLQLILSMLFLAVGFVLLIVCANVANLLLARAATREKEIAVRVALGARRFRLIRQFLTESVLLALLGGLGGLVVAMWGVDVLKAIAPDDVPRIDQISLDGTVLLYTLGVSLLTGLIFGLAPAIQTTKPDLHEALKEGGRISGGGSRHRLLKTLVVSEVALAVMLIVVGGLMIRSFLLMQRTDPGFDTEHLLTLRINLLEAKYPEEHQRASFYQQVLERVETLPGVESAAAVNTIPLGGNNSWTSITIEGRVPTDPKEKLFVGYLVITPHYLRSMGIPLLQGRSFNRQDVADAPKVVLINQTMARRFWPEEETAVGRRFKGGDADSESPWLTVVGVVADVKHQNLAQPPRPEMYLPHAQTPSGGMTVVVRAAGDPAGYTSGVRGKVWEVDPNLPVFAVRSMAEVVDRRTAGTRATAQIMGVLAGVALMLAAVGIYGVISYSVSQRTHEIGIRMALGASPRDIFKLVVRQGVILVGSGLLLGLVGALALARVMSSVLFGVTSTDVTTYAGTVLVLVGAALLACYIPARRATRVDPLVALRYE